MKRRTLLIAALLLLGVGLCWFFWPRHTRARAFELKFLRQAVENGKQVAFFRVEGAEQQLIQFQIVAADQPRSRWTADYLTFYSKNRMGGAHFLSREKEFNVLVPTNSPVWKLRVIVYMEHANPTEWFKARLAEWNRLRNSRYSFPKTIQQMWTSRIFRGAEMIESDSFTNSVPPQ